MVDDAIYLQPKKVLKLTVATYSWAVNIAAGVILQHSERHLRSKPSPIIDGRGRLYIHLSFVLDKLCSH